MQYRVTGISEAAVEWSLNDGDVVDDRHPAFAGQPTKWRMYLERGYLVPMNGGRGTDTPETAMVAPPENAMRPRARARQRG